MRCAWVKIDTNRLTLRLWKSQGKWPSDLDLRRWLKDRGYTWRNGGWYTHDGTANHLEAEEIIETQTTVTEDGVTFVIHEPPDSHSPTTQEPPGV